MSVPYVFGGGASPADNFSGTVTLPANGGSIAVPLLLPDTLYPKSVTCRTTDTTGTHTLEVGIYWDGDLGQLVFGSFTFTASVAAVRTGTFDHMPALRTGGLWLVCRNAGSTTTTLSTVAASGLGGNYVATQTLGSLGLVLPSTGWTPAAGLPLVRIDGGVSAAGFAALN